MSTTIKPKTVAHRAKDTSAKTYIEAMISAQAAMSPLIKNKTAHKYTYADLGALYEACKLAFLENGFCILQTNDADDQGQYVETKLLHVSGESFSSKVYLYVSKPDMQGLGSAITYARRYGLMSISGLSAEEDDDGKRATAFPTTHVNKSVSPPTSPVRGL